MRIRIAELAIDEKWKKRAEKALNEVLAADEDDRSTVIDQHEAIWRVARRALRALSHGKCWYSEAPQSGAQQDVDHFRPKGGVFGHKDSRGYWWLAFDPANFRLSCQFCNQIRNNQEDGTGGKSTYFPLEDESERVNYGSRAKLKREQPLLLDPCDPGDIGLLWFEDDGQPVVDEQLSELNKRRVEASISIYNLRSPSFVKGRVDQIKPAKVAIAQAKKAQKEIDEGDPTQKQALENAIQALMVLLAREQPYTAAVRCILMSHRSRRQPWVERVLQSNPEQITIA